MTRRILVPLILFLVAAAPLACRKKTESFRHDGHVTVTRGDCGVCHGRDPGAPRPAAVDDCVGCHREAIAAAGPGGNQYSAVRPGAVAARQSGYADIRFAHGPHADAGIVCIACHPASNFRTTYFPTMAVCRDCHAKEGARNDCPACHKTRRAGGAARGAR